MDDFEAPSFSLGLDAEVTPISDCNKSLQALNPFKVGTHKESIYSSCKNDKNIESSKRNSDPNYDSDFELLSSSSTPRIMKRLQRKSGHSVLTPSENPKQVHHAGGVDNSREALMQQSSDASKEKKAGIVQKDATGSKGRTLPNFWKGLHCKAKASSATSCSQVTAETGAGSARKNLKKPKEVSTGLSEIKSGTLESTGLIVPDTEVNGSNELTSISKEARCEGCTGQTYDDKADFNKAQGGLTDRTNVDITKSTALNTLPCELHGGESLENSKTIPNDETLKCPMKAPVGKTNFGISSHGRATALQSFWKSLNEKTAVPSETNGGIEEDDIENFSTDDDFETGAQSTKRLSLSGNKGDRKSLSLPRVAACTTPIQGLSQRCSKEAFVNLKSSSGFQSSLKSDLADEMGNLESTTQDTMHLSCLSSPNRRTKPNFAFCDAAQNYSPQNLNSSGAKGLNSSNKNSQATSNIFLWQNSDEDRSGYSLLSNIMDKNGENDVSSMFEVRTNASDYHVSKNNPSVANLLRVRFPHFLPVSALRQGESMGTEQIYIDYKSQFLGSKASSRGSGSVVLKQFNQGRQNSKWRKLARDAQKSALADSNGWIQMGKRRPADSRYLNRQKRGRYRNSKMPDFANIESDAGPGHWITETGKKIYITKDGRKLRGSSAFRQYAKDSGKGLKGTKRKRPRRKKARKAT